MEPRNYLSVYHIDESNCNKKLNDLDGDPYFSDRFVTWGICRPNVRTTWVSIGSVIFFIGYKRSSNDYLLKGYIRVGEKLDYIQALERFPNNRNVILAKSRSIPKTPYWKSEYKRGLVERKYKGEIPDFLAVIKCNNEIYYHNPNDTHEIDNWKCERIFLCNKNQFAECVTMNSCIKESEFKSKKGYIVADKWEDYGKFGIKWESISIERLKSVKLKTKFGQHNPRNLSNEEVVLLFENIENHIKLFR